MNTYKAEISWGKTLWINLVRSLFAAVVWIIVAAIMGETDAALSLWALPLIYFPIFLPLGLLARALPGSAIFGFLNLMAAITILPGDPLLFIASRMFPQAVPVANYPFVYFGLVVFVTE